MPSSAYDELFDRLRRTHFYGTFTFQLRDGEVIMIDSRRQFKNIREALGGETHKPDEKVA